MLRQGFRTFNDKVTLGLSTCKIYDQFHVKRCNNCQSFGHYYKNCPSPDVHVCANCGDNHATRVCQSQVAHCVNCTKAEVPVMECDHRADDQDCPTLCKAQEKMKHNLNMQR